MLRLAARIYTAAVTMAPNHEPRRAPAHGTMIAVAITVDAAGDFDVMYTNRNTK